MWQLWVLPFAHVNEIVETQSKVHEDLEKVRRDCNEVATYEWTMRISTVIIEVSTQNIGDVYI